MKILITGGTGFIGSRLALRYLHGGDAVRVFGQVNNTAEEENQQPLASKGAELIEGSVADKAAVKKATRMASVLFSTSHRLNTRQMCPTSTSGT
jgi:nucleoside-diphosphate-sugar epimerase